MSQTGPPPEIWEKADTYFAEHRRREQERVSKFGDIRPVISAENWGKRFVAVRNRLHWGNWKVFADFLDPFVGNTFGTEWSQGQLRLPEDERHPLMEWRKRSWNHMNRQEPQADGIYATTATGFMAAYYGFAYDLYVVADNNTLDEDLLARLKHPQNFQGARHELFAEATCLRAGFTVMHEDETDRSRQHVEFIATHKKTGQQIAVEAKSKHRPGVLGREGRPEPPDKANLRFGSLINNAARKQTGFPLVIFLDTNLPPANASRLYDPQSIEPFRASPRMEKILDLARRQNGGSNDPYNLLVFTNHPHHYAREDEADPKRHFLTILSQQPAIQIENADVLWDVHRAATLYGNIPKDFPQQQNQQ